MGLGLHLLPSVTGDEKKDRKRLSANWRKQQKELYA